MKKILVIDESKAVRETLGVILGRDFAFVQRPPLENESLSYPGEEVDLLIMGISPGLRSEPSIFLKIASQVPCPVLFLVDSRSALDLGEDQGRVDWLAKPFNPYELKERVSRLLARPHFSSRPQALPFLGKNEASRYIDFPYVPASVSILAKRFALTPFPILIIGEAGCGQERLARAISSLRGKGGPWLSVYPPRITKEYVSGEIAQLSQREKSFPQRLTLFLSSLETLHPSAQSSLLDFLEEEEEKGRQFWILSSSQVDLLEKVYRGDFLSPLYYRLATLTLRLPPLRERRDDLPSLAARLVEECSERLDLRKVSFSAEAIERLCNYLWFGNLDEMEAVIARTLAIHRKGMIEAPDLVLGVVPPTEEDRSLWHLDAEDKFVSEGQGEASIVPAPEGKDPLGVVGSSNGNFSDLRVLINELAHELKNPMVTINTFAQLLRDRFDDIDFRVRFQETVGGDIERMDQLLEALLDFSRFTDPAMERIFPHEELRRVLEEILPECSKREATIRWERKGETGEVFADGAQFRFAFKNVLCTVLGEVKPKGEIQIDVEGEGRVAVAYVREGERMSPFSRYLERSSSSTVEEETLPLRMLLAKILLERNGGGIKVNHLDGGKVLIRAELRVP